MVFTSVIYLLFFTGVYSIYWLIPSNTGRKIHLFLSSLFFYGTWNPLYLLHFLLVLLVNFIGYLLFLRAGKRKYFLSILIFLNLGNLLFYKYIYFIFEICSLFFESKLQVESLVGFKPILPLAISFYTFQIISFFVDVYRVHSTRIAGLDFFLYFSFFPQLIAGPILRTGDLISQFNVIRKLNLRFLLRGIFLIMLGITKKTLLADNIASLINPIWKNPYIFNSMEIFLAANGFCMQVYCDFSGYSDIAIGSALLLGYEIPKNFNAPFFSQKFSELWKNWHMSLSNWLKDYIYIPLGGNRSNLYLLITFTVGGLWHGASYSYIFWGFFCGSVLILEKYFYMLLSFRDTSTSRGIQILTTYLLFTFSILFFRSENPGSIPELIRGFLFLKDTGSPGILLPLLYLIPLSYGIQIFDRVNPDTFEYSNKLFASLLLYAGILVLLVGAYGGMSREFIYFQF